MLPDTQFARKLVRTVNRLMIESTCIKCGATSLVSDHDGTLEEWEEAHTCNGDKPESRLEGNQKQN